MKKPSIDSFIVHSFKNGRWQEKKDALTGEEPLEIIVTDPAGEHKKTMAVTMRTPEHDDELATGFLFSEGLLNDSSEVLQIKMKDANTIVIAVDENTFERIKDSESLNRYSFVNASCGVCGRTSIESLKEKGFKRIQSDWKISAKTILTFSDQMRSAQKVFDATGGLHAAGLFTAAGELVCVREDIGRHNAVDKIIGHVYEQGLLPLNNHIIMVSGRLSYEIVQKAVSVQTPILAAISAPSNLAVKTAFEFGLTLVGFLRSDHFNVYTYEDRIS